MTTGVRHVVEAIIDVCSEVGSGQHAEPHLRQAMRWPGDPEPNFPWLWCLGYYDQHRQNRRVVIGTTDGVEELLGEGLTVVGSAYRPPLETGACGECRHPEDFDWDYSHEPVNDAPVMTCHQHGALAPGWAYEVEVGALAYRNHEDRLRNPEPRWLGSD